MTPGPIQVVGAILSCTTPPRESNCYTSWPRGGKDDFDGVVPLCSDRCYIPAVIRGKSRLEYIATDNDYTRVV